MSNPAMSPIAKHTFPPHPTTARAARNFVATTLTGTSDEARDLACLLTSELVTNAVVHARTDVDVSVLLAGGRLRVEVGDQDTGCPTPSRHAPDETTGRGLLILDAIATRWGVDQEAAGKVVWFEFDDLRNTRGTG